MYVCVCVCMYVCVYIYIYIYTHVIAPAALVFSGCVVRMPVNVEMHIRNILQAPCLS